MIMMSFNACCRKSVRLALPKPMRWWVEVVMGMAGATRVDWGRNHRIRRAFLRFSEILMYYIYIYIYAIERGRLID